MDTRALDNNNRVVVQEMTDREIAEESLIILRAFSDAMQAINSNPMLRAMMPGLPSL